jgi:curved DNA-binding protein
MREARKKANKKPRKGADVTRKVALSLQEAYCGTTRPYTAITAAGQERHAELKIPPGVATGTKVRYTGQGLSGQAGGSPGDLYLLIEVTPHPGVERVGNDLYHRLFVPLAELAHGGIVRVRMLDGRILNLLLPPGTRDGHQFRLAGEGMPQLHQPECRGDLFVTVSAKPLVAGKPTSAATDQTGDDSFAVVFFAVLFMAGLGAGLFLYWLILA